MYICTYLPVLRISACQGESQTQDLHKPALNNQSTNIICFLYLYITTTNKYKYIDSQVYMKMDCYVRLRFYILYSAWMSLQSGYTNFSTNENFHPIKTIVYMNFYVQKFQKILCYSGLKVSPLPTSNKQVWSNCMVNSTIYTFVREGLRFT